MNFANMFAGLYKGLENSGVEQKIRSQLPANFDHVFENLKGVVGGALASSSLRDNYDMTEDEKEVIYTFPMPGFTTQQIKVTTEDNFLVVVAKRESPKTTQSSIRTDVNERIRTPVCRPSRVVATYQAGLLTVKIPKQPVQVVNITVET